MAIEETLTRIQPVLFRTAFHDPFPEILVLWLFHEALAF
jgi:hypothetical protein